MTWYSWSPCREISCPIKDLDYYGLHTHGYHSITHWNEHCLLSIWLWCSHVCMKAHSHRNTQGNDMPLSEFSSVHLQTKMKHVIYLLWSPVVHLGMYWWLDSPMNSWTASYPRFLLKTAFSRSPGWRPHDATSMLHFMTAGYHVDVRHRSYP